MSYSSVTVMDECFWRNIGFSGSLTTPTSNKKNILFTLFSSLRREKNINNNYFRLLWETRVVRDIKMIFEQNKIEFNTLRYKNFNTIFWLIDVSQVATRSKINTNIFGKL